MPLAFHQRRKEGDMGRHDNTGDSHRPDKPIPPPTRDDNKGGGGTRGNGGKK
jgi:hypothetical protein